MVCLQERMGRLTITTLALDVTDYYRQDEGRMMSKQHINCPEGHRNTKILSLAEMEELIKANLATKGQRLLECNGCEDYYELEVENATSV